MPLDATRFADTARPLVLARGFAAPGIPVARPRLPAAEAILPYLREIDANHWYANHGLLWLRLQSRLAAHWGMGGEEVALTANATLALALALRATGVAPGRKCLMPAWTFVATAGAAREAGLVPHFADVDAGTWALDPEAVEARPDLCEMGAILVVAPFGRPLDLARWDALSARTGVPVIVDAAAAFDALRAGGAMVVGRAPVIVSLHATKSFGIGEGGAVLSRDAAWLERLRRLSNFGFLGSRDAVLAGTNAKMSEYAAAIGLAAMDAWPETRAGWLSITRHYAAALQDAGLKASPGFGEDWVSATLSVLWSSDAAAGAAALAREGIGTLRWWGDGCHANPAYADCPRDPLPVTEAIARRALGLPFWRDMTATQVDYICGVARRAAGG
ncbi:aminotransferase class I/II-fold pyridoxal phosphate-dependent enzyme [Pararoseomonas indoligenes]|uniref:Aminotransferase class I/II-fold pyridoxal phosphate-dependent enzyme n=1 Tax=Roseomonas indoligenes TaxID=2820811 RepID=A0A940MYH2_9PROT|nr:aminotransferase class I/II-fold pyridoxal phosphate-dependent enzyme [Pararoseomonas indoligenes]MBP0494466.1 aminotransferase class I/II-fold pyridoxal phosphate-dependent enzyme [Pararoseomonas indoligenes]